MEVRLKNSTSCFHSSRPQPVNSWRVASRWHRDATAGRLAPLRHHRPSASGGQDGNRSQQDLGEVQSPNASSSDDEAYIRAARSKGFRLFSNLHPETLAHEPGTFFGAAALVTGTTVGAGILALPAVTAPSGFLAASATLAVFAGFSIVTGLLVAEVNINTLCELGAGRGVSLSSMARRTLGDGGAAFVSAAYLLIHYALLVAYISKAGETLDKVAGVPVWLGDAAFVLAVGGLCFAARPATLNRINTVLVGVFVASFFGLVSVAAADMHPQQLAVAHWEAVPDALPVVALSYVYQNVVPVVATNLEGDVGKIRQAIIAGVAVPWLMFECWLAAVLGSSGSGLAVAGPEAAGAATIAAADPLAQLRDAGGPLVTPLIDCFTFLAVATSAIGFILGLSDYMADALQLPTGTRQALPYLLAVVPPLACAIAFPDVFFSALDFAGTYGVLTLFGLVPVFMCWSERYGATTLSRVEIVGGGRPLLIAVAGVSGGIIARELLISLH